MRATVALALSLAISPLALGTGCAAQPLSPSPRLPVIAAPPSIGKPPYRFNPGEEKLLDDVQHACFQYFWHEASKISGMVPDRTSNTVVSVAGVGYQLASLPIGVERGWVTRAEAAARAELILSSLLANPNNRRDGLFYHFLDPDDAGPHRGTLEHVISTIDSAILLAGVLTAGEYFEGKVKTLADSIAADADWRSFVLTKSERPYEAGFISLGFKPREPGNPNGAGELLPYVWADAGDEQRLVTFLAVGAVKEKHRVDPKVYYQLRRAVGSHADTGPFVWFPWSGALFTNFFAHCWINYGAYGIDNPAAFGVRHRAAVDWWENSRRAVRMHQMKAVENPRGFRTLGQDSWGLTASDAPSGYAVPGLFPTPLPLPGAVPNVDYADHRVTDDYGDGTVAPYGAGSSILFDPRRAIASLEHYRNLRAPDGSALVWRQPSPAHREYGFRDAFNIDKQWVASDYVAIDQGPLLICIENARTGLIWELFARSVVARNAIDKLGLKKQESELPR